MNLFKNNEAEILIKDEEIFKLLDIEKSEFPKYLPSLLNLANVFSQATRPKIVGQMTELFKQYLKENSKQNISLESWREWYLRKHGGRLKKAKQLIKNMLENFKEVLENLRDEDIENWLEDLVIKKTFVGLYIQQPILLKLVKILNCENYRLSYPDEESKGIDAFLICNDKEIPIQIKSATYKEKGKTLKENINVPIVYYEKTKEGIRVDYFQLLQFLQKINKA